MRALRHFVIAAVVVAGVMLACGPGLTQAKKKVR